MNMHPPYPATTAALGGVPTKGVDIPICTIFMLLYIIGAASHMTVLQINMRRGHKFIISGMMFGFCMSRLATMILRIVWAVYPHETRIAIAANVFVSAGVVLLFVINILFAQRIIRATHPNSGWHPVFHYTFIVLYVVIVLTLIMLITSVVQSPYTLNLNTRRIDRDIQLYGGTFYAAVSFLPILLVIGGLIIPRKTRVEKFGSGRFRHKIAILLLASFLLCAGATFRIATNYAGGKRPRDDPAGYQNKACFYIFNFTVEILVIYLYLAVRVDRRFFVPDGSHGPGDYSRRPGSQVIHKNESRVGIHIASEEEVFDDMDMEEFARHEDTRRRAWDEEGRISTDEAIRHSHVPSLDPNTFA